jgi:hypothetical protein
MDRGGLHEANLGVFPPFFFLAQRANLAEAAFLATHPVEQDNQ